MRKVKRRDAKDVKSEREERLRDQSHEKRRIVKDGREGGRGCGRTPAGQPVLL